MSKGLKATHYISGIDHYGESYVYFFSCESAYLEALAVLKEGYEMDMGTPSVHGPIDEEHIHETVDTITSGQYIDVLNALEDEDV